MSLGRIPLLVSNASIFVSNFFKYPKSKLSTSSSSLRVSDFPRNRSCHRVSEINRLHTKQECQRPRNILNPNQNRTTPILSSIPKRICPDVIQQVIGS